MYELNLGFDNAILWRKCKVTPLGGDRYRLDTPMDSAVKIVESELLTLLETIPEKDRDRLVVTGAVPPEILLTAAILKPYFKEVAFTNPKRGTVVDIPQSPADQQVDPE